MSPRSAQAAATVARAEAKWRLLLQSTSDTVTLVDENGLVRQSTGEFTDVLGYEFDWWPGRSGFDLIHPDDLPRAAGVFAELVDNPGETYAEVLRTRNAAGHWELIEYTAVNRLDDPLVESIVITTRNVTEFTQAEAMLADEAKILELIARGAPLEQTLETIAVMVDYHTGGDSGVFLLDDAGRRVTSCAAPSMPDELVAAARRAVIEPDYEPIIGRTHAAECGDFGIHAGRTDADFLLAVGYHAGWSVPVIDTRDERVCRHDHGALRRAPATGDAPSAKWSTSPVTWRPSPSNAIVDAARSRAPGPARPPDRPPEPPGDRRAARRPP